MFAEVQRRMGEHVLDHAFDAFPELRAPVPRTPSTFAQQAAAVKKQSGTMQAVDEVADTDRPPLRESDR